MLWLNCSIGSFRFREALRLRGCGHSQLQAQCVCAAKRFRSDRTLLVEVFLLRIGNY